MKRFFRFRRAWLALSLMLPAVTGCDHKDLSGSYSATAFQYAMIDGPSKDVLAAGGSVSLVIGKDLTTSGSVFIPASVAGSAVNASLLGSVAKLGDEVELNLVQYSVLGDLTFAFDGSSLTASGMASNGVHVAITLSK